MNTLYPLLYQLITKIYRFVGKKMVGRTNHREEGQNNRKPTKQNRPIALMELKRSVPLHEHHTVLIN